MLDWLHLVTSFRVPDTGSLRDVHLLVRTAQTQWLNEGAWRSVLASVVDVLKCCVLALSIFVLGFMVNWVGVVSCGTEQDCLQTPVIHTPSFQTVPGSHTLLLLILFSSAVVACLYECKRCVETCYLQYELHDMLSNTIDCGSRSPFHTLRDVWFRYRAAASGHEELPLSDKMPALSDLSWSEFLHLFCTVIQKDKSLAIHRQQRFDELRAIQALMVYDNYFIALHQRLLHPEAAHGFSGPAITLIDQSILRFLVQSLFDSSNCLDVAVDQHRAIRDKLFNYLIAYWAFYPFLVSHALVKMVVKNVAAFRARPSEFLDRQWTQKSWWAFRLFNEVTHVTDERLVAAQELANHMLGRIRRPSAVAKFLERLSATIIVAILFIAFLNPSVLMGGMVAERSLVWWLSTWFLVYSAFHVSDLPLREYHHKEDLQRLCHLIHYEAGGWNVSGSRCASSIQWDYFHSRWYLLAAALCKTLLMPLILLKLYFDESIPLLVEVIQANSSRVDGVGSIAADADFSHNPRDMPQPRQLRSAATPDAWASSGDITYKHEKSIASFASVYPRWRRRAMSCESVSAAAELGLQDYLASLFDGEDDENADDKSDDGASNDATLRGASVQRSPSLSPSLSASKDQQAPASSLPPIELPQRATRQSSSAFLFPTAGGGDGRGPASPRSRVHQTQHRIVSRVDMLSSTALHWGSTTPRDPPPHAAGGLYGSASQRAVPMDMEMLHSAVVNMPADGVGRNEENETDTDDDAAAQQHVAGVNESGDNQSRHGRKERHNHNRRHR
jgi:autophagy-related protein 9